MSARPDPRKVRIGLAITVFSGSLVSVQQRINGRLGTELNDVMVASLISFATGLVVVVAVVALRPASRRALPALRLTRPWERLGGLGGASLVAVGAFATPRIGVALLTVGLVAGQTGGGLLVDRVGLGPSGAHPVTARRTLAAVLCLVAVVVSSLGGSVRHADPLLLVSVVAAGVLVSGQQALNGRVRARTGDAPVAVSVNFVTGTVALTAVVVVRAAVGASSLGAFPTDPVLYLGGTIGALFVGVGAIMVRLVGVLRLGLAVIAGQVVGAVLLDLFLPVPGASLSLLTVVGAGLALAPIAVIGRGRDPVSRQPVGRRPSVSLDDRAP